MRCMGWCGAGLTPLPNLVWHLNAGAAKRLRPCAQHKEGHSACGECLLRCTKCQLYIPLGCFAKNETDFLGKRSACKACAQPQKYEATAMRLYRAALATIGRDGTGMTWNRLVELGRVPRGSLSRYIALAQHYEHQGAGLWELRFRDPQPCPKNDQELSTWTNAMMHPNNVMICLKWPV